MHIHLCCYNRGVVYNPSEPKEKAFALPSLFLSLPHTKALNIHPGPILLRIWDLEFCNSARVQKFQFLKGF